MTVNLIEQLLYKSENLEIVSFLTSYIQIEVDLSKGPG